MPNTSIGSVIQQIRLIKGLTQKELAEVSNLSLATIAKVETGNSEPRANTLSKICKGLGIKPEELYKILLDAEKATSKKGLRDIIVGSGILMATIAMPPLGFMASMLAGAVGGGAIANAISNWFDPNVELDEQMVIETLKKHRGNK